MDRLHVLEEDGIFTEEIDKLFHYVRKLGNKAAHDIIYNASFCYMKRDFCL